jgi:rhodanese-related sulfurtransferase
MLSHDKTTSCATHIGTNIPVNSARCEEGQLPTEREAVVHVRNGRREGRSKFLREDGAKNGRAGDGVGTGTRGTRHRGEEG